MLGRLINGLTWLLVAGSLAVIMGGLAGRPVLLAAVPTGSMAPALRPGDLILVVPLWGRTLSPGQVIVFRTESDATWIVHRIVGGDEAEGFITRGDANRRPDPHRVFPRHVAGRVPEAGERLLKVSGLGALSLERGPLSHPVLVAVAMVAGIYLLVADDGVAWRRFRRVRLRPAGLRGLIALYLALGLGVALLTYLSGWSLSSRQAGRVTGGFKQEQVTLENPSLVPLLVGMSADHPGATWAPAWVLLPPGGQAQVTLTLDGLGPGTQLHLRQSVLLPFLPLPVLRGLDALHWHAPAVAIALMPLLLMAAVAATDRRVALRLGRLPLRLALWWR